MARSRGRVRSGRRAGGTASAAGRGGGQPRRPAGPAAPGPSGPGEAAHGHGPGAGPGHDREREDRQHGEGRHEHGHGGQVHAGHDRLGNPQDMAGYLARLEGEDRIAWQKPDEVIRLLGVKRGDRVCDVGVGPGYFALRLARAVGPQGEVYAFDAEPRMLEVLRQRMREQGIFHVRPILAEEGVPPRPCDLVLVVNTFHHFRDGAGYLRRLAGHLKPGGRIANVDFHRRELPVGPPLEHKVAREDFLAAAAAAGLRLAAEHQVLPYQYFLVLEPEPAVQEAQATAPAPEAPRPPEAAVPAAEAPPSLAAAPDGRAPGRAAPQKAKRPARRKPGSAAPRRARRGRGR